MYPWPHKQVFKQPLENDSYVDATVKGALSEEHVCECKLEEEANPCLKN